MPTTTQTTARTGHAFIPLFTQPQIDDAVAVRHQLHQHPELKFEETDTAKRVAERLTSLGYKVTEGIATTGVLAELDTGRKGL